MENKLVRVYYLVQVGDEKRFFRHKLDYIPYSEENYSFLFGNYANFETAFKYAPKILPEYIHADKTIFHKDCLIIDRNLEYDDIKITARNFKPIKIFKIQEIVPLNSCNVNELMMDLPAEKLIPFLISLKNLDNLDSL